MKLIDKYILKKFLTTFVFVVVILVLVICVIDFTEKNDNYIKYDVSAKMIFKYYLTFVPFIIGLLTPITVFIATVFVTSNLAVRTEIIAILASGVSFKRVMFPYLLGATFIAIASFYLNSFVIPDSNKFRIGFELNYLGKPFANREKHIHFKVADNQYIYMEKYNVNQDEGRNVTLEEIKDNKLLQKLSASRIKWNEDSARWTFIEYDIRKFDEMEEVILKGERLDSVINMSPSDFDNKERFFETLTMKELESHIDLLQSRGADDVGIYQIEKYIRIMQPFTVLILTFIGIIVSARKSRGGTGFQIALGFLIAFLFIIIFIFSRAIAEAQTMHPILAVWIPNIGFSIVGLIMYFTVPR
ncbi:MAG: LptF/LptG family permease [Cyclobacteriaceae bacterium]